MTASPLEARCEHCHDTGSLSQHMDGPLDCHYCEAANQRLAMRNHIAQFTGWPNNDTGAWAAYLFAQRQAAPVAAQPEEEIDFLAMEFPRSTLKAEDWEPATKQPRKVAPVIAAQPATPKLPSTPEEVVAFIGDHYSHAAHFGDATGTENLDFFLSVHDLLSCFQNLADFAGEAAQPAGPDDMAANYDHSTHDKRMEVLKGSQAAQQVEVARITQAEIDYIGEQWDECMYDAPGMMIDIGQSIRAELAKLNTAPPPAAQLSDDVALKALKFANHIINGRFEGGDWGGGDVQELAVKYGLLEPQTMQGPCNEDGACECAQNCAEFPSICYRKTYTAAMAQEKA